MILFWSGMGSEDAERYGRDGVCMCWVLGCWSRDSKAMLFAYVRQACRRCRVGSRRDSGTRGHDA